MRFSQKYPCRLRYSVRLPDPNPFDHPPAEFAAIEAQSFDVRECGLQDGHVGRCGPLFQQSRFMSTDDLAATFLPVDADGLIGPEAVAEDWSGPVETKPVPIEDLKIFARLEALGDEVDKRARENEIVEPSPLTEEILLKVIEKAGLAGGVKPNSEAAEALAAIGEEIRKTFEDLAKSNSLFGNPRWLSPPNPREPKSNAKRVQEAFAALDEQARLASIEAAKWAQRVADEPSWADQDRFAGQPDPPKSEPLPDTIPTTFGGHTYDLPRGEDRYERAKRRAEEGRRVRLNEAVERGAIVRFSGWDRRAHEDRDLQSHVHLDERIAASRKERK